MGLYFYTSKVFGFIWNWNCTDNTCYGENSSGKSTIIECLRMIRQSGSSRINTRPEPTQLMI